jgi:hypothetical protein
VIPADHNLSALAQVARELRDLGIDAVFLGGATLPLLVAVSTRIDLRLTKDVDCVVRVASHSDWESVAEILHGAGWMPSLVHDDPNCRFRKADLVVDVMPVPETGVGPDNPWFAEGIRSAWTMRLDDTLTVRVFSPPTYLASKIHAYLDRGRSDPLESADFEDIVALLDGVPDIAKLVRQAPVDVRSFIADWCGGLVASAHLQDILAGQLGPHAPRGQDEVVLGRMEELASVVRDDC